MTDTALARSGDPDTSWDAAASINGQLTYLESVVLGALRDAGARGCTIDELTEVTSLDKVTASPRLRPLCNKRLVIESGTKRPGKSGRAQMVWKIAPAAAQAIVIATGL